MTRLAALLALAGFALGQDPLHPFPGDQEGQLFGSSVAAIGDLDGDGLLDVAVGGPYSSNSSFPHGRVALYSGASGVMLRSFDGQNNDRNFGGALDRFADLDGDGFEDLLVGAPNTLATDGRVIVVSAVTGERLLEVGGKALDEGQFGTSVAHLGDVNGDGISDFAAGAPLAKLGGSPLGRGAVLVHSGANGAVLWSRLGDIGEQRGSAVTALEDLNGDGVTDVAIGAPGAIAGVGAVRLRSGTDGALIREIVGTVAAAHFGDSLSTVDDLDGDGVRDVLVASSFEDGAAGLRVGKVRVLSSMTGALLQEVEGGRVNGFFGRGVDGVGDVNGDGVADWAAGAPGFSGGAYGGSVRLVSGADGSTLREIFGANGEQYGSAVAGTGDASGDGYPDLLGGAPAATTGAGSFAGEGRLHSSVPFVTYCTTNANSTGSAAAIRGLGTARLTRNDLVLEASPVPDQPGLFFYGAAQTQIPMANGVRCVDGALFRLPVDFAASGVLRTEVDHGNLPPGGAILVGETWNFQAWFRDPAGGGAKSNTSDALAITFEG